MAVVSVAAALTEVIVDSVADIEGLTEGLTEDIVVSAVGTAGVAIRKYLKPRISGAFYLRA